MQQATLSIMRTVRIYQPGPYVLDTIITLNQSASHHVSVVLRMQASERILLFGDDQNEYTATILEPHKKSTTVRIVEKNTKNRESPLHLTLVQSLAKGDKMEWVIQKAVELGVQVIVPLISARSVVKLDKEKIEKKQHQWRAIAISACEQSQRNTIPEIKEPLTLESYLRIYTEQTNILLDPYATQSLKQMTFSNRSYAVLVGPEGGFTEAESALIAAQPNTVAVHLGPRILRTETAGLAMISILQALAGDF